MFAFQGNNATRVFEYPWAFHATPLEPGMKAVDIGGSLAGFQFVLARNGVQVINVDPGEMATGLGWQVGESALARLNKAFGTNVELRPCFLQDAGLPATSFDRVFSISTIEHIPQSELPGLLDEIRRVLVPGGCFVATVDLFLDLAPFTNKTSNQFGTNVDIRWLADESRMTLISGSPAELYGFPEFDAARIAARASEFCRGESTALAQAFVLQKE